jgi:hypothetical protein
MIQTNNKGTVDFSGKYGDNLMDEINKYAVVASVIAEENDLTLSMRTTGLLILPALQHGGFG